MTYEEIKQEALKLPLNLRLELAYALVRSLDEDRGQRIRPEWIKEIEHRYQDYLDGKNEATHP